ncbi:unnamed protein product [Acanthoscelides obtectus]|uniref:Serine/arginine repetitive matrix protein 1 n=1 Tax=Acanthoscelides obtectus TaxID=200917 RepID=A0A9P0QAA2_ACAOB|nr:unnamed protein product [Acanthoscelides obtectus]CAK1659334.1 Serine/arginine repetitive matrix protein 1 [Acanthoscelides obtectus]
MMYTGTNTDQDNRFSDKEKKLLKQMKFNSCLSQQVDMTKVKLEVIKPWIQDKLTDMLKMEDDVVVNFVYNQLEVKFPDPKKMQINLTGFLQSKNAMEFMAELWALLISAQESASGIPESLMDAKREELAMKKEKEDREREAREKEKEKEKDREKEKSDKEKKYRDRDRSRSRRSKSRSRQRKRSHDRKSKKSRSRERSNSREKEIKSRERKSKSRDRKSRSRDRKSESRDVDAKSKDRKSVSRDRRSSSRDKASSRSRSRSADKDAKNNGTISPEQRETNHRSGSEPIEANGISSKNGHMTDGA